MGAHIARKFFHHLLRSMKFEKAFLLAVDIGARDLFMDIHYVAIDKGEYSLAEVSKRKADQIETDLNASDSFSDAEVSDEHNSSFVDYEDEAFEDGDKGKPLHKMNKKEEKNDKIKYQVL